MRAPWYRNFTAPELPSLLTEDRARVTVIAGVSRAVTGAVTRETTAPLFLDLHLPAGARFAQALPPEHNAFVYVYRGQIEIAGQSVPAQRMAILANDPVADGVVVEASVDARVLLIAGRPLREPIAQYGPFVMTTAEEIRQVVRDFNAGRLA